MALVGGDLHDSDALVRLVAGSAAVIHAAGAVRGNSRADFDHINVAGTGMLLAAIDSLEHPPRLLLLSSLAAREPQLSWYAASKRAGEALLEARRNLDWVILRPPAVYGPGDREMLPVFRSMARGIALVPGTTTARLSLIHVADLVQAVIACLQAAATRHRTFCLSDGVEGGYDWQELAAVAAETFGRPVRLWPVPTWLLDGVARVNIGLARITGRAAMLTPAKLRELRHGDWVADNEAITAATGWTPKIGLKQGLDQVFKAEL